MDKDTFHFMSPDKNPEDLMNSFRRYYGPTMNAYEAAEKNGTVNDLHKELVTLTHHHNTRKDSGTSISATFMRVTVNL